MKIGLQIPSFTWPGGAAALGARLAEIGRTADEAGFASLWVGVGQAEECLHKRRSLPRRAGELRRLRRMVH